MPSYVVTSPDGKKYRVNAPDGATQDQVLAYAQQQFAAPKPDLKAQNPAEYDPASPEYKAKYGATSGMTDDDLFMAGAGKAVVDAGRGIRQLGATAMDFFSPRAPSLPQLITGEDPSRAGAIAREQDAVNAQDAELSQTGNGLAGNVTGNLAMLAAPAGWLSRLKGMQGYRGAAAVGAAQGAVQPVATNDSRAVNVGVGAVAGLGGQALVNTVGRVAQPVTRAVKPQDARAVRTLQQAGVPLDAAQRTGSKTLGVIKSGLKDNIATVARQAEAVQGQTTAFTRAVLRSIGVNADVAEPAVMNAARTRLSQEFETVLTQVNLRPATGLVNRMQALAARSKRVLPGDANQITRTVDDILAHVQQNGGRLDGRYYNTVRGDIAALEAERGVAPVARDLREALDNAFQQAAGKTNGGRIQEARRQWRNLKIIENAIDTEGAGTISPAKLANQFGQKRNRSAGIYGQGDKSIVELARLAQAGKKLLTDKNPNSGTTARALTQAAIPAAVGAGYGLYQGDPQAALMYGVGGLVLPRAAQRLMNSSGVSNYLANGITQPAVRNSLLALQQSSALRMVPAVSVFAQTAER